MPNLVAVQGKYTDGDYRDIKSVPIGGNAADQALAVAQYVQSQVGGLWIPTPQPLIRSISWTYDAPDTDATLLADVTVRLKAKIRASDDSTMNIDIEPGSSDGITPAPTSVHTTAGSLLNRQIETATVEGTCDSSGDLSVTITADGLTGSPVEVSVSINDGDSAATVAAAIRQALIDNTDINNFFYIDTDGWGSQIATGALDGTRFLWAQLGATSDQPFTITVVQSPTEDFSDWDKLLITQSQSVFQNGDYRYLDKVMLAYQWVQGYFAPTSDIDQVYMKSQLSLGGVLQ